MKILKKKMDRMCGPFNKTIKTNIYRYIRPKPISSQWASVVFSQRTTRTAEPKYSHDKSIKMVKIKTTSTSGKSIKMCVYKVTNCLKCTKSHVGFSKFVWGDTPDPFYGRDRSSHPVLKGYGRIWLYYVLNDEGLNIMDKKASKCYSNNYIWMYSPNILTY